MDPGATGILHEILGKRTWRFWAAGGTVPGNAGRKSDDAISIVTQKDKK